MADGPLHGFACPMDDGGWFAKGPFAPTTICAQDHPNDRMWLAESFNLREVLYDMSSSGGTRRPFRALVADDITLMNMIENVEFGDDPVQVVNCCECGMPGCADGNYLSFRRLGDWVAWIPAYDEMLKGEWERTFFAPPDYVAIQGIPLFSPGSYSALRSLVPNLPPPGDVARMTSREAVWCLQSEAPLSILGVFPSEPRLDRARVLAMTEGEVESSCDRLERFLQTQWRSQISLEPIPAGHGVEHIEFHLDGPRFPAWGPVCTFGAASCFHLPPAPVMWEHGAADRLG